MPGGARNAVGRVLASGLCVAALACLGGLFADKAHAGVYKMLLCAGNNGSNGFDVATNTTSAQNPGGIFSFENYCGPAPDPAGNSAFLRIAENQPSGSAGVNAYGSMSWTTAPWVNILGGGGYTRMPNAFNDGWRGRFWLEGWDGSANNVLMQGAGVQNGSCGGVCWATTSTFASHLWPFPGYGSYRRFVFELLCVRAAGCDRSNFNAVDANTMLLILDDTFPVQLSLTNTGAPLFAGQWVKGTQTATYVWNDLGSGIRFEWINIDGGRAYTLDHAASCNLGWTSHNGEFARVFQPCPTGSNINRSFAFNSATLADGAHTVQACAQDYGQQQGGGASCDQRVIRVDNTAPAAPLNLRAVTPDGDRYRDSFDVKWDLPANAGSPITRVHYRVVDAGGAVVVPEKVATGTNPVQLTGVSGPPNSGNYKLQLWLEDQVGFVGPAASVPLPRDTNPPAAPQDVSVTVRNRSRGEDGFDVRWRNLIDAGSPVVRAYYEVRAPDGEVVVPTQVVEGQNVQAITELSSPSGRGEFELRIWLADGEGNVGAAASVPLSYSCVRAENGAGTRLTLGVGASPAPSLIVRQGEGSILSGRLLGGGVGVGSAPVCVFSRVKTEFEREFIGLAMTSADGSYRFPVAPGPSRRLQVAYRAGHREVEADADIETIVKPTLKTPKPVVRNKTFAYFEGEIPGPNNNRVVVVLQVRSGKGWLAFRRYRTRENGRYKLRYHFRRTSRATTYEMRAQVRETTGYPYLQGNSAPLRLRVVPGKVGKRAKAR